ncbi:low-density lipoprotein receptor-related protein 4-like [Ylistrum balloti]|uniref:low-density lipoprotein receptor-related protein 4-like n=1 Tax=Ylistrum balloti TaxID=509963 RepID=UPI002905B071|nr:low-density lipoprotein receptor-related protein 4-like [Ylistrum balloti]
MRSWTYIQLLSGLACLAGAEYYVLMAGEKGNKGNIEIYNGTTWFDLCPDGWDDSDASVMCRMLGYSGDSANASVNNDNVTVSSLGQDKFDCDGSETSLDDCPTSSNNATACENTTRSHLSCAEVPEPNDFFLMSFGSVITKMNRATGSLSMVQAGTISHVVVITYDHAQNDIIWTDNVLRQIAKCDLNGGNITVIFQTGNDSVMDGIAIDVESRLIFYTDTGYDEIGVINADTYDRTVLINTDLDEPRAIVLDTTTREIFWTDWGTNASIVKANYDGSGRTSIVSTGLGWPNAMVLDGDVLIWCDAQTDVYESVYRNGTGRTTLLSLSGTHCFAFTIYEDYLYVNDWLVSRVIQVKKDGSNAVTFGPELSKRYGIFHYIKGNIK